MATELEQSIKRFREHGYTVHQVPAGAVSADGYVLLYTVGEGLASGDDMIRIAAGLDHLPTGPGFVIGQAVQLITTLTPPTSQPERLTPSK